MSQERTGDLFRIKAAAKAQWGHISGVEGFGIGAGTLRVYVSDSGVCDTLPHDFQGVPIDFVITGPIKPL